MLAAGDTAAASAAADELRDVAIALGTPLLRADAALARGAVLLADGKAAAALIELRSSFSAYHNLGVRCYASRARLFIADACHALGDHEAAEMESTAARVALDSLTNAFQPTRW